MKEKLEMLMNEYQSNLFVIAFNICKNAEDAKDVVQDTFIDFYTSKRQFNDDEHIKAWLIRATINKSKNVTKTFWRRNKLSIEDYMETLPFETNDDTDLFEAVLNLPEKYRIVIHLFYYEDLSVRQIANILKISESNVKVRLSRGRQILKDVLKEDWEYEE